MVTRKAITGAFELIINEKNVKTVTLFVNAPLIRNISRVRITRVHKGQQDFRVQLGLPNFAEKRILMRRLRESAPTRNPQGYDKVILTEFPKRKKAVK